MTTLTTARLVLRPPRPGDGPALVDALNNFNVSRWTGRIPHPYGPADAAAFLDHHLAPTPDELMLLITRDGALIGGIGIGHGELGYWLAEPQWGKGYGTEAARAVTDHAFATAGHEALVASYHFGNAASRRILLGLGFVETGTGSGYSKARQADVPHITLRLTRAAWAAAKERRQ